MPVRRFVVLALSAEGRSLTRAVQNHDREGVARAGRWRTRAVQNHDREGVAHAGCWLTRAVQNHDREGVARRRTIRHASRPGP